ncbi:MAG: hypothetical protein IJC26_06510, partial [Clostridia bacterium]|nr:hypothetical protein [Clostridia bacterium]
CEKMLQEVAARLKDASGIDLTFSPEVTDQLARDGFDPVYGARPLRRAIQKRVEDSLSTRLLEGKFTAGDSLRATLSEEGEISYFLLEKKVGEENFSQENS